MKEKVNRSRKKTVKHSNKHTAKRTSKKTITAPKKQQLFPYIIDVDRNNNNTRRPMLYLPTPTDGHPWITPNILFYQSSSSSNANSRTYQTWFPLLDIVTENNIEMYLRVSGKTRYTPNTNNPENTIDIGYLLKMQFLKEMHVFSVTKQSGIISREIAELLIGFLRYQLESNEDIKLNMPKNYILTVSNSNDFNDIETIAKTIVFVKELQSKYSYLVLTIPIYFICVWQIVYSVHMNPEGQLWDEHPEFRDFIMSHYPVPSILKQLQNTIKHMEKQPDPVDEDINYDVLGREPIHEDTLAKFVKNFDFIHLRDFLPYTIVLQNLRARDAILRTPRPGPVNNK